MNFKIKNNGGYERIPQIRNSETQSKNEKATSVYGKRTDQTWERI